MFNGAYIEYIIPLTDQLMVAVAKADISIKTAWAIQDLNTTLDSICG